MRADVERETRTTHTRRKQRAYTEIATMLQQQNDLRKNSLQQLAEVPA